MQITLFTCQTRPAVPQGHTCGELLCHRTSNSRPPHVKHPHRGSSYIVDTVPRSAFVACLWRHSHLPCSENTKVSGTEYRFRFLTPLFLPPRRNRFAVGVGDNSSGLRHSIATTETARRKSYRHTHPDSTQRYVHLIDPRLYCSFSLDNSIRTLWFECSPVLIVSVNSR